MDTATLIALGTAVATLAVVLVSFVVSRRHLRQQRHDHAKALAATIESARAETESLRTRLDELAAQRASEGGLLITDAGQGAGQDAGRGVEMVPDRLVLSATLGEPLIRLASVAHGLGRALSAETRNRIGFEMRREYRRARKQRKRETRAAWRRQRTGTPSLKEDDAA